MNFKVEKDFSESPGRWSQPEIRLWLQFLELIMQCLNALTKIREKSIMALDYNQYVKKKKCYNGKNTTNAPQLNVNAPAKR